MKFARIPVLLLVGAALAAGLSPCSAQSQQRMPQPHPDLPKEFQQILPRGRIASVDHPRFVPANEAVIPDGAWVIGVVLGGEAHAYSINLLNHHEVVNDKIGDRAFAAVW